MNQADLEGLLRKDHRLKEEAYSRGLAICWKVQEETYSASAQERKPPLQTNQLKKWRVEVTYLPRIWVLDKDLHLLEYKKEDSSQDQHPMQSQHQEVDQTGLEELHQHQEVAYHQEVDHCLEEDFQQEADSHQEEDSRMVEVDQEDHQEDHQEDPRVDRRQDHQVVEEALFLEAVDGIRTEI